MSEWVRAVETMSNDLYLDNQRCLTAVVIYVDGKALLMHDQTKQSISTSITAVQKEHLQAILKLDETDPFFVKVNEFFDPDRDPIEAAFAYAALVNVSKQFQLAGIHTTDEIKILRARCGLTQSLLDSNSKDAKMMAFSINVDGLPEESRDDLAQRFVLVDRKRIYAKPCSSDPREMDVFFMGLKMTRMTGIICLLFWDSKFI